MAETPDFPIDDNLFTFGFPVFVLAENVTERIDEHGNLKRRFDGPKAIRLIDDTRSFPIFFDHPAADQFIEHHSLTHKVAELENRQILIAVLKAVHRDPTVPWVLLGFKLGGFRSSSADSDCSSHQ